MKPAVKLTSFKVHPPLQHEKKYRIKYGKIIDNNFKGIIYYDIHPSISNYLLDCLIPYNYKQFFTVLWFEINHGDVLPHTDSDIKTVINIYIETNQAITSFYKVKDKCITEKLENQTNGNVYDINNLIPIYNFSANPFDIWILNVNIPHSVQSNNTKIRTAFCLQTNLDYEYVLNLFKLISN